MRDVEPVVNRMAGQFPAVLVTGARQTGKTSLLRHLFPRASYITLDLPAYAEAATTAPDSLLNKYPEPLIIDEIQYAPVLDDAAGLRALEIACGKKIKVMKIIVAKTGVRYQLRDGSWVMGMKDLLEILDEY